MGWLIDPKEQTVLVYLPNEQVKVFDEKPSPIPVPLFAGDLRISIDELFSWLMS